MDVSKLRLSILSLNLDGIDIINIYLIKNSLRLQIFQKTKKFKLITNIDVFIKISGSYIIDNIVP